MSDWTDTEALGELIVSSLGEERAGRDDLLSRWIAHHLAELIEGVRKARSARARRDAIAAAADVVVRLWTRRSDWPEGWPPPVARQRMSRLTPRTRHWDPDPVATGSAWIDNFPELESLAVEELRLWFMLGLLETGVEDQRERLASIPKPKDRDDEPEDIRWLRTEVQLHDEAAAWAKDNKARNRAAVRQLAADAFAEIAARRSALVASAVSAPLFRRRRR